MQPSYRWTMIGNDSRVFSLSERIKLVYRNNNNPPIVYFDPGQKIMLVKVVFIFYSFSENKEDNLSHILCFIHLVPFNYKALLIYFTDQGKTSAAMIVLPLNLMTLQLYLYIISILQYMKMKIVPCS